MYTIGRFTLDTQELSKLLTLSSMESLPHVSFLVQNSSFCQEIRMFRMYTVYCLSIRTIHITKVDVNISSVVSR